MTVQTSRAALDEVATVALKHSVQADERADFPVQALDAMRRTRLLGLCVPAAYGGSGGGPADLAEATMLLGRADMSVAMIFAMHCQQAMTIARYGDEKLRSEVLPAVADGHAYLASVTTEPGSGGDLLTSGSQSADDESGIRIDRMAPVVTGGAYADGFLITARSPGASSPAQIDLIYAARDQLITKVVGGWDPLGMRATHSVPMQLTGTVPEWQIVGEHGNFRTIATSLFGPLAHIGWSAAWLGTAAGALARVVGHVRGQGGHGSFDPASDLLLTRFADVRSRLEVVHALLVRVVTLIESDSDLSGPPARSLVNTLKTRASDECFAAVHELMDLAGLRHGYLRRSDLALERAFRDLRSASLNYHNDRLRQANGSFALLDRGVGFA
jgi:acyl-CoA dehydrogenase